jgi:branched-chain amino acid transport system ATP-binding protein
LPSTSSPEAGVSLLLVEQYVSRALAASDHLYPLNRGQVTFFGPAKEIDEAELTRR